MNVTYRYLYGGDMYLVVSNFASETETVILSNVIKDIEKTTFYVHLASENSAYTEG